MYYVMLENHTIELCCMEGSSRYSISKSNKECTGKRSSSMSKELSGGCPSKPGIIIEDAFRVLFFLIVVEMIAF